MAESHGLEPPLRKDVADPGAHQLAEASDSEDQFMDAQSIPGSPDQGSPVPEVESKNENGKSIGGEAASPQSHGSKQDDAEHENGEVADEVDLDTATPSPNTPKKSVPVPITVVEESTGETPGQHLKESNHNRDADASPDIMIGPSETEDDGRKGSPATDLPMTESPKVPNDEVEGAAGNLNGAEDNFGDGDEFDDDFDDFEEGDGQDKGFDDFNDGFLVPQAPAPVMPAAPVLQQGGLPFAIPDFDGLSPDEVKSSIDPYLSTLFPPEELDFPSFPPIAKDTVFLTQRSASLWSQLVAPPPLSPPDWIRSHTRRLFLVSLGVPVDLDEILPASKQKKLILPSPNISSTSPRSPSFPRSKQGEGNTSSTAGAAPSGVGAASTDENGSSSSQPPPRKRKGPPPEPRLDLVAARHVCQITDEALDGMTDEELQTHVARLEAMEGVAKELLDYWARRTDEMIGDRETFEGVIENLVAHARKVRK